MEAVVKSLDPNSTAHRDAILDTATEILGHVVKTSVYIFFSSFFQVSSFLMSSEQVPDRRLPHGNSAVGSGDERRGDCYVRPQNCHQAVCLGRAQETDLGLQLFA